MIFDVDKHELNLEYDYNPEGETDALEKVMERVRNGDRELIEKDLLRVYLWKLNRVPKLAQQTIKKLESLAKDPELDPFSDEVRDLLDELKDTHGVSYPTASTFLRFLRPEVFPIIDRRAYRALFGKATTYYTTDKYFNYMRKVHEICKKKKMTAAQVDEQLYQWDIKHNGKL